MRIKTVFFGSPEFAKTILESLLSLDYIELVGIVTKPDKEFGRKKVLKATPVKEYIKTNYPEMKVFEPIKLRVEAENILNETKPELIIVAAYGKILPDSIINYPKYKCLNVHGSLLPILRGAVPVQSAILQGFTKTGVSVQIMKQEMDEGEIVFSKEVNIDPKETTDTLMNKLAILGADLITERLIEYINGGIIPIKQNSIDVTYCFLSDMSYEKALIDWNKSSIEIDRQIRAFFPDPISYTNELTIKMIDGKECNIKLEANVRIYQANVFESTDGIEISKNILIGDFLISENKLLVKTGVNFINILKLQLEGRNIVSSSDFINGIKSKI